jgi:hypothetical protein
MERSIRRLIGQPPPDWLASIIDQKNGSQESEIAGRKAEGGRQMAEGKKYDFPFSNCHFSFAIR